MRKLFDGLGQLLVGFSETEFFNISMRRASTSFLLLVLISLGLAPLESLWQTIFSGHRTFLAIGQGGIYGVIGILAAVSVLFFATVLVRIVTRWRDDTHRARELYLFRQEHQGTAPEPQSITGPL